MRDYYSRFSMKLARIGIHISCLVLCCVTLRATPLAITWSVDSTSAFDVTVSGAGSPLASGLYSFGTITPLNVVSPSGLWQFSGFSTLLTWDGQSWNIAAGGIERMTYPPLGLFIQLDNFGGPPLRNDPLPEVANRWRGNGSFVLANSGWNATAVFSISSESNPSDPTTWTWQDHFFGSGPGDVLVVPDSGMTVILLTIAVGTLVIVRPITQRRVQ